MNDSASGQGALLANIMHFARILRATGLPIGPGRVIEAVRAVEAVGLTNKTDFYWTLHAVFVNRHDQRDLFDQAFRLFWRDPQLIERMMALLLPQMRPDIAQPKPEMSRRLAEALQAEAPPRQAPEENEERIDAAMTVSDREILQAKDFEQMSTQEIAAAKRMLARLRLPIGEYPTRRFAPHVSGTHSELIYRS